MLPLTRALRLTRVPSRVPAPRPSCRRLCTAPREPPQATPVTAASGNQLADLRTRDNIHAALAARALDAVRYDYFAQRADLEAELDAAAAFRALVETTRQQAMGYLELLEEYGDAEFGPTLDNLHVAAAHEREAAQQTYPAMAEAAATDQLQDVGDWFEDMAAASSRAADRLELVSSMLEADEMDDDDEDDLDDGGDGVGKGAQ